MKEYELIIVGGGAAGVISAVTAYNKGLKDILIIEKDPVLGGALNLGDYNISEFKYITGKEYKKELLEKLSKCKIDIKLNTMVIKVEENNQIICTSSTNGIEIINGKYIILANGSKEGSRKAISMVGDRCAGIYTVGMAKKIFNMENLIPGKNIFIDGNATLYMLKEELKKPNIDIAGIICNDKNTYGLTNKIYEGYEISSIQGSGRITSVTLTKNNKEIIVDCDTLIFARPMLSDGVVAMRSNIKLNPETTGPKVNNKFMTSRENIYACGNGIYIHKFIEDIEDECRQLISNIVE